MSNFREAVGKRVLALHRSKIGNIEVRDLKLGTWRYLTKKEVNELKHSWERKVRVMKKIKYIILICKRKKWGIENGWEKRKIQISKKSYRKVQHIRWTEKEST